MVSTRRSRNEEPASHPASHDDSDSDDAPEEVTLTSSRNKAIQERREERRIRKENVEKSKRKQSGATKKSKQEDNEVEKNDNDGALDLLPSSVLKDVAREDEHEEEEEYERDDDRRIAQRRLISEQLKLGLMQGKKRKFTEKRTGPVVVKTLGGVSSRSATDGAKAFLQGRFQRHQRSLKMHK